jgi:ParB family transcriptional regulator, chromosome partitioning protein
VNTPTKRRGLGRGLDALLPVDAPSQEAGVRQLKLFELHPSAVQPRTRFAESDLEQLADSIREQGIVQPLIVTPDPKGGFIIVAGERRWRAARRAGLESVPAVVRQVRDERHLLELALVENLQRSDLNALEEAEAYQALQRDFGLAQDDIAQRVGKSRPTITNSLRLLKLPLLVRELLRSGELSAGQARPLLTLGDPEAQEALARRAVAEGLSARQLETRVSAKPSKSSAKKPKLEPNTVAAADRLTQLLSTRVEIRRAKRGGEIRLRFHDEEDLMRLYELLSAGAERSHREDSNAEVDKR